MRIILIVLILISFTFQMQPQEEFIISRMPGSDQYPYKLTYSMMQDNKGFLWFGTMYGLLRFDGLKTVHFRNDVDDSTSLGFDDVVTICQDKKNNLWIGTWGGGLVRYDAVIGKFSTFTAEANGLSDNIIFAITEDASGIIWLGTQNNGLSIFDPVKNKFTSVAAGDDENVPRGYISVLTTDSNNDIWIGTQSGLYRYNWKEKKYQHFELDKDDSLKSFSNNITSIEEFDSEIWISTRNGLFRYDRDRNDFGGYDFSTSNNINSIAKDENGFIWLATMNGLTRFNPATKYSDHISDYSNEPFLSSYIGNVMVDRSGIIWVCSYERSLFRITYKPGIFSDNFIDDKTGILNTSTFSFTQDAEGVWIGTINGSYELNKHSGTVSDMPEINKYPLLKTGVLALNKSTEGLYVGTRRGLYLYDLDKEKLTLPDILKTIKLNRITSLMNDKKNNLWIGTYDNGFYKYDKTIDTLIHYSLNSNSMGNSNSDFILTLFEDKQERIWIGTYSGIRLFVEGKFISFTHDRKNKKSISNNYVYSIYQDIKGRIWAGTANGLNLFNETEKSFTAFYEKDGLSNNVISAMNQDDSGFLWITTFNGITRFDYENKIFKTFSDLNGLPGNYFNSGAILKVGDKFYCGSSKGLAIINPDIITTPKNDKQILISSVVILSSTGEDESVFNIGESLELSYSQNSVKLILSSSDYTAHVLNNFKLFVNDRIVNQKTNEIILSDLSPGVHNILITAENHLEQKLVITILPPFWLTWWFIIISILILSSLIYISYKMLLKKKVNRIREIEKIKIEQAEQIRKKTAIDFHDELGHRLTRISLLSGMVRKKIHNQFDELTPLLDKINENSSALYDGTKDFIWSIDPSNDSLYELLIRMKDFGDEIFTDGKINFEVKGITDELSEAALDMDWKRHLSLILKEAMNNSLKHSHATKIILETSFNENEIEIILSDDGIGITDNYKEGNGLRNMQRRAQKLKAQLNVTSEIGKGTKISFKGKIPGKSLNYN
ncbi:MAG: hypothetical protein IPM56_12810 [Ignavibacteriales bacterium]|nr:MAG: hypothetical protein IPM56_12810 [Ignavibacteriales bacterium]